MFELWLRNDGQPNSPALICDSLDHVAKEKFFPPVSIERNEIIFGGQFATPALAARALREASKSEHGQEIVLGQNVEV